MKQNAIIARHLLLICINCKYLFLILLRNFEQKRTSCSYRKVYRV